MICDSCSHKIVRTFANGAEQQVFIHCDLDGKQVFPERYTLKECSRNDTPVVVLEVKEPEPVVEPPKKKPGNPNWVKRGT